MSEDDVYIFSHDNILRQLESAEYRRGYFVLRFYSVNNIPVSHPTSTISEFYLYPHAGTLRDNNFNLVFCDSRYDIYQGFQPPGKKKGNVLP
ncbi:MAG: hypothetical protein N3A63_02620 [Bacteroidetes bacterium]|nr:hypothetical protein [Bacteroidota bacterium]